jgi:hypothetical protein
MTRAYDGLTELVDGISAGRVGTQALGEEVDRWIREYCRGAASLARAAVLAARYELAAGGLRGSAGAIGRLRSLAEVEGVLAPRPAGRPVEVAVPEELRCANPKIRGFVMGEVQILAELTKDGFVMTVSHPDRYPTFDELLRSRAVVGRGGPPLYAEVPPLGREPPAHRFVVSLHESPPGFERAGREGPKARS